MIIGTFMVTLDTLTPELYNAAKESMQASGQGVLVKTDGGAWVDAAKLNDPDDADSPSNAVKTDKIDAMKLTVKATKAGVASSMLTAAELQQEIERLTKEKDKLQAAQDEATAAQKPAEAAQLALEKKNAEAQIAADAALLSGDAAAALKQLQLVGNPDKLAAAIQAESDAAREKELQAQQDKLAAAAQQARAAGDTAAAAALESQRQAVAAQLAEQQAASAAAQAETVAAAQADAAVAKAQQRLAQALAAGTAEAASQLAQQLIAALAQQAAVAAGSAASAQALAQAQAKLEAAQAAAVAAGDAEQAQSLAASLAGVADAILLAAKEELFLRLDAGEQLTEQLAAQLKADDPLAPAIAEAIATSGQETLLAIAAKEKEKYTAEELAVLEQASGDVRQQFGAEAQPIPAENVISGDMVIKFDTPPVIIDGKAYIPVRPVSQSFGAAVDWDDDTLTATISKDGATIVCTIGSGTAYIDGSPVPLDAAPQLILGRTMVPLRFIAEGLGMNVVWDDATHTIRLSAE